VGYGSKRRALVAADAIRHYGDGPNLHVYHCDCGRWHLTSQAS
jgi:hypothetical protein